MHNNVKFTVFPFLHTSIEENNGNVSKRWTVRQRQSDGQTGTQIQGQTEIDTGTIEIDTGTNRDRYRDK